MSAEQWGNFAGLAGTALVIFPAFKATRIFQLAEQAAGTLPQELRAAAELTDKEMRQLQESGMRQDEAWMLTREKYLFPPEEPELTAKDEEQIDSPMWDLLVEKNKLLDQIWGDDD